MYMAKHPLNGSHHTRVGIPAQQWVLATPRLCVLDVSPSPEEILMAH